MTQRVIRSRKSEKSRQYNCHTEKDIRRTMIYKTLQTTREGWIYKQKPQLSSRQQSRLIMVV